MKYSCPLCGNSTSGAPTECTGCVADKISNAAQFMRAQIPYSELGSCARCTGPARVYGPKGSPVCGACEPRSSKAPQGQPQAYEPSPVSDLPWLQPQECSGLPECREKDTKLTAGGWRCGDHPAVTDMAGAYIAIKGEGSLPEVAPPKPKVPAPRKPSAKAEPAFEMSLF